MLTKVSAISLTLFFLLIPHAQSQIIDLGGGVSVTQEQINALQSAYAKTNQDTVFFHWMDRTNAVRWISQGALDQGEVMYYNIPTGKLQVFGPGLYLAKSPTSSKGFGTVAVAAKVLDGTPVYDQAVTSKLLGATLNNTQISVLGEHIPFIRELTPADWHVTNHYLNAQNLTYGGLHDPLAKAYAPPNYTGWKPAEVLDLLNPFIKKGDQDAQYLKKILLASDYMDGISWARAMMVNPSAPWNEFEPENFGKYENAIRAADDLKNGLEEGQNFQSKDIREIFRKIHSAAIGADVPLRNEGIRAGGVEIGQRFKVDANELKALQANAFLTVEASPPDADGHFLVDYFYPDAFHYQGVKPYLSPELVTDLDAENKVPNGLLENANADLRHSLNQRIESELLDKVDDGTLPVDDLIDIHAYDDDNGRTSRIVKGLFHNQPPHNFIGDFDTELPPDQFNAWMQKGVLARENLHAALVDEFLMAKGQGRMPDYLKTGAVQKYVDSSFPLLDTIDISDKTVQEQIRQRQWDQLVGKNRLKAAQQFFDTRKGRDINGVAQEFMGFIGPSQFTLYDEATKVQIVKNIAQLAENKNLNINARMNMVNQYESYLPQVPANGLKPIDKTVFYNTMLDDIASTAKATNWNDLATVNQLQFINQIDLDGFKKLSDLNRQMLTDGNLNTSMKAYYAYTYSGAAQLLPVTDAKKVAVIPVREVTNDLMQSFVSEAKKYPTQILPISSYALYLGAPSAESDYFLIHSLPNLDDLHQKQVKDFITQQIDSWTLQAAAPSANSAILQQRSKQAQTIADEIIESSKIGDKDFTRDLLNRYTHYYQALLKNANLGKGKKLLDIPRPGQLKVQVSGKDTYKNCVDGFLQKVF